jgi:Prp8 binding protein
VTYNSQIYSASADKTGAAWDVESGTRLRRFREHTSFVNSIACARKGDPLIVTGSDDCKALVFDARSKRSIQTLETEFQVLSVAFSDDTSRVFTAGIDNDIKVCSHTIHCPLLLGSIRSIHY